MRTSYHPSRALSRRRPTTDVFEHRIIRFNFGILRWALIRGWAPTGIITIYLEQVNPAVFLKILLHVKLEPVVTLRFHSFELHAFFSCLIETKSECF